MSFWRSRLDALTGYGFYTGGGKATRARIAKASRFAARRNYRRTYNYIPARNRGYTRRGGYYGRYNRRSGGGGHTHMQPELKFLDKTLDLNPITAAGTITNDILLIPQGTGESERIGRKCRVKLFSWRFTLTMLEQTFEGATHDQVKLFVIWDKQANGDTPSVIDILELTNINSFRNLSNKNRFRILATRSYNLTCPAGAGDNVTRKFSSATVRGEINHRCNMPIEYDGVTGAKTEVQSNNILIMMISLDGRVKIQSRIRVRFEG